MAKARTLVGLDVHAAKIVAAILDVETGELQVRRLGGETAAGVELCGSLPAPTRAAYEAGPTGYGLARGLQEIGVDCVVAAPGKIPRAATDRIKITRSGSGHARRLVEAAWHYRRQPRVGEKLAARQQDQPAEAVAISWSAQRRLQRLWRRLERRGKRRTLAAVAVARELAGFSWAIARVD